MTTKISAKFGEIDFEYTVDSSAPEPQTCYKERRKPQITVRGCASSQLSYNDGTFTCTPTLSTDDPKCPAMTIGGTDVDTTTCTATVDVPATCPSGYPNTSP